MRPTELLRTAEQVLEVRPPRRAFALGAGLGGALVVASAIFGYFEYAATARAPLLALALAGVCFGSAAAILCAFRFTFPFQTRTAPRTWAPPNVMAEPPIAEALGLTLTATRRPFLALLTGALSGLLALLLLPLRSLAGRPKPDFAATAWRRGVRLLMPGGGAIRPEDLAAGSSLPVVPEGAPDDYNSAAVLVRLRVAPSALLPARDGPAAPSIRVYSRICTHAGCAVSIFLDESGELVCPCHFSRFDAKSGGAVLGGPASQALPELPIAVDADGFLVARADFDRPVGPLLGCGACRGPKRGTG
jgi:ubiquinol-cytochrome c reductase iron-sulfur subunit